MKGKAKSTPTPNHVAGNSRAVYPTKYNLALGVKWVGDYGCVAHAIKRFPT